MWQKEKPIDLGLSFEDAVGKAEHLAALDIDPVFLSKGDMPWHLATKIERHNRMPNTGYRDFGTHYVVTAHHWESSLDLYWHFNIRRAEEAGGIAQVNEDECRRILAATAGRPFHKAFLECLENIRKNIDTYVRRDQADKDALALDVVSLRRLIVASSKGEGGQPSSP